MQVRGHVAVASGGAVLMRLEPARPTERPPTSKQVWGAIRDGTLAHHSSKAGVTRTEISAQICNIQRGLYLGRGADGEWNSAAQDRLEGWLLTVKTMRGGSLPKLATFPQLALPAATGAVLDATAATSSSISIDDAVKNDEVDSSSTGDDSSTDESSSSKDSRVDDQGDRDRLLIELKTRVTNLTDQVTQLENDLADTEKALESEQKENEQLRELLRNQA